ncbi:GtrA family protein [Cohnella zeiphila]|uniref:GtrA family protein n=1 Tax=Cohnella zeiphila TaxID=2761120 RepID=A0A7X0VWA0_9BACL|nr:GtrA family protein [Cohnella zeiphila]MBB6732280.1 GtrA family protein [Cohnella zeiphila]
MVKGIFGEYTKYLKYLMVGAASGIITVAAREVFQYFLNNSSVFSYVISVALAYIIGICVSYILNSHLTFNNKIKSTNFRLVVNFFVVSGIGFLSTTILSLLIRYLLSRIAIISFADTASFVIGTLITSILTYSLNSLFVFKKKKVEEVDGCEN